MRFFSIIVVTYKNHEELISTIESIDQQSIRSFHVYVIDGDPESNSENLLNGRLGGKLTYLTERDAGIYNAMNKAFKFNLGDYFIFLNSGDEFYDRLVLEKIEMNLGQDEPAVIFGRAEIIDVKGRRKLFPPAKIINPEKWLSRALPNHQAMFFSAKKCSDMRFNEDLMISADSVFKIEAMERGFLFADVVVCNFYRGGTSSRLDIKTIAQMAKERYRRKDRFGGALSAFIFILKKIAQKIAS